MKANHCRILKHMLLSLTMLLFAAIDTSAMVIMASPEPQTNYTEQYKKTETIVTGAEIHVREVTATSKYKIRQAGDGYAVENITTAYSETMDGKDAMTPFLQSLVDLPTTIILDEDGWAVDVEGVEAFYDKLQESFGQEVANKTATMVTLQGLKDMATSDWNTHFGMFGGLDVEVGDSFDLEDELILMDGARVPIHAVYTMDSMTEHKSRTCLVIKIHRFTDGDEVKEALTKYWEKMPESGIKIHEASVEGDCTYVTDIMNGLVYSSVERQVVRVRISTKDTGPIDQTVTKVDEKTIELEQAPSTTP